MVWTYYCVAAGRVPGIYGSWSECSSQVTGFRGAIFKGQDSGTFAKSWMRQNGAGAHAILPLERREAAAAAKAAAAAAAREISGKRWEDYLSRSGSLLRVDEERDAVWRAPPGALVGLVDVVGLPIERQPLKSPGHVLRTLPCFETIDKSAWILEAVPFVGGAFMDAEELLRARREATAGDGGGGGGGGGGPDGASSGAGGAGGGGFTSPSSFGAAAGEGAPRKKRAVCGYSDDSGGPDGGLSGWDILQRRGGAPLSVEVDILSRYVGLAGSDHLQMRLVSSRFGLGLCGLNNYIDCSPQGAPENVQVRIRLGVKGRARVWIRNAFDAGDAWIKMHPIPAMQDACMDIVDAQNKGKTMNERCRRWRGDKATGEKRASEKYDRVLNVLQGAGPSKLVLVGRNEGIWDLSVRGIEGMAAKLEAKLAGGFMVDGKLLEQAKRFSNELDEIERREKQAENEMRRRLKEEAAKRRVAAAEEADQQAYHIRCGY